MNNIPPFDLTRQYKLIGAEIEIATQQILNSGRYIGGNAVKNFEQQFADYIGTPECISCNSGTDALYLALRALNIGASDEVITTTFTFIATAETIAITGAKPVFADIDADTFNIDLDRIEAAITPRTKAIIPVHLFGQPVNMTKLMAIAKKHNLFVIEDVAQATGAEWEGEKLGSIGDIGCFSFYPTKNLGACGDGGAITTKDLTIAKKIRMMANHGMSDRYQYEITGVNSRLDALQAAILQIKLSRLDRWNQQRTEVADRYQNLLAPITEIKLPQAIFGGKSVWNQYTIRIKETGKQTETYRDKVRQELKQIGVNCMVYYPMPLHLQPVYRDLGYPKGQLPVSEQVAREVLSLPMFPEIYFEEQEQVAYSIKHSLVNA
ncbi:MAG: DegT/DnrJ/EryC1/StrS family aminotransferase [Prochloraceae cyanobacterium]|nr:DegT/DnrJ/EryC1/StrS family aminotransferase [Prochloraceae cyanobacterium]